MTKATVTEQLLYEMHDPAHYLVPDVSADVTSLQLMEDGENRIKVSGAKGHARPEKLKATVCVDGGYMAEELLGQDLQGTDLRNKIEIVTKYDFVAPAGRYETASVKYYDTSRAHILASVDHSLRLMEVDHIDLLLLHRPDPLMDHLETGASLDELVASGKIRSVGVSNFKPYDWDLLQSAMKQKLTTNQIELSVLEHNALTNGDVAFHQRLGTRLMAWSPLASGRLFQDAHADVLSVLTAIGAKQGKAADAVAIAWLLAHPANILPVMGTNNIQRIQSLSDCTDIALSREEWFEIYTAALGHQVA